MENWTDKVVDIFVFSYIALLLFGITETVIDGLTSVEESTTCICGDERLRTVL